MQFSESEWPLNKKPQLVRCSGRSSSFAFWAGACGAVPFGLAVWIPLVILLGGQYESAGIYDLLWILLAISPLIPFVIASASIERREWPRVLGAIFIGLAMGVASAALFFLAFLIVLPAAALGLVFGLTTLVTRWRDGACRALAMLGLAPTLLFFVMSKAGTIFRPHHADRLSGAILTQGQWSFLVTLLLLISHVLIVTWAVRRVRARFGEKSVASPDDLS